METAETKDKEFTSIGLRYSTKIKLDKLFDMIEPELKINSYDKLLNSMIDELTKNKNL